ncbi:MAG: UDP-glucose 4-epimerase GalE [Firmicutes bacterium HGW-Firmicutes-14]|nr:MAG: UDP-glucose 4-epimerase GalE [Firmicutes bacterium HGW-Firmicutes-14]
MSILITGGAGYIGSHTVKMLAARGYDVVVYDNLSKGHKESVSGDVPFVEGDTGDKQKLAEVFRKYRTGAVIHFAAYSLVGESAVKPGMYYRNNVANTLSLLDAMLETGVSKIVFSSTAAVYGEPGEIPITEDSPREPTNVYGTSKLMVEKILESYDRAYGLRFMSLRYFNAAGADPSGFIGEDHDPETHLIPIVLQAALGQREHLQIYGTDYNTPDGTCIRDYIHVNDLADAHIRAVGALRDGAPSNMYNLGNGTGFSVKEVVNTAETVTGRNITAVEAGRREGDPAILVAGSEKIKRELGWEPDFQSLADIISSAWRWHSTHLYGYRSGLSIGY